MDSNGDGHQAAEEPRIPFGDRPNQMMPASWAEAILRDMFEHNRPLFGKYLQSAVTGIEVTARGRKPGQ
jgi:hypothetical protein